MTKPQATEPVQDPTPQAGEAGPAYPEQVAEPGTAAAYREAVAKEYGQYVAVQPIDHDGVRAYNTGDPVPISNVERHHYADLGYVAKRGTKAADEALRQSALPPGRA